MRVPVNPCHSIWASWRVGWVVVTRVWRRGGGGPLWDAGKLYRPANYTTDRCLTYKRETRWIWQKMFERWQNTQMNFTITTPEKILTISEFPLLFSFLWGGMGRRGASLFPSLRRRERSEFHGSKLDGGRKGGITAFSLSLGSRVKGAPLLSYRTWNTYRVVMKHYYYY